MNPSPAFPGDIELFHYLDASMQQTGGKVDLDTPAGPLSMTLPPGLTDGQTLRLAGRGELGPDGKRGDVLLTVSFFAAATQNTPPQIPLQPLHAPSMSSRPAPVPPPVTPALPKKLDTKLIVIIIVAALAALLLFILVLTGLAGFNLLKSSPDAAGEIKVKADISTLSTALRSYEIRAGRLPTTEQGLRALLERPPTAPQPRQWVRMLAEELLDPWGHSYRYANPATRSASGYDLWSVGADGQDGTADDIGNFKR